MPSSNLSALETLCNRQPSLEACRDHAAEMYDTLHALSEYCQNHDTPMGTALLHAMIMPVMLKVGRDS